LFINSVYKTNATVLAQLRASAVIEVWQQNSQSMTKNGEEFSEKERGLPAASEGFKLEKSSRNAS